MKRMSLIFSKMRKHIAGEKHLTESKAAVDLISVDTVAIPLANGNSTNFDVLVEVGENVKVGTNIGVRNDGLIVPVFSSVSGVVKAIEKLDHALGKVDHVIIENDHKYEAEALETIDYKTATSAELVEFTMNKGIVGCGGAGFPTYVKYRDVKGINKVIINAVECEPYITSDYQEIDNNINHLINGALAMKKMANASEVVIAIKKTKKDLIAKMNAAIDDPSMKVELVPDQYPMGWERSLIRYLEKKEYENLPSELGLIVNNSTTAILLSMAMETGMPIVRKRVTVSGDALEAPANLEALVGTKISDLLDVVKVLTDEIVLIDGGPMMGQALKNADSVVTPYSNAYTVMHEVVTDAIACLRCGSCSDHCPAGLQPVRIMEAFQAKDFDLVRKLRADKCIECGLCSYVCPSKIDVARQVILAKTVIARLKK